MEIRKEDDGTYTVLNGTKVVLDKMNRQGAEALCRDLSGQNNTMTLQERLVSEALEKIDYMDEFQATAIEEAILHTIEQTIKEGCEVIERLATCHICKGTGVIDCAHCEPDTHECSRCYSLGKLDDVSVTDTQHALRGIIKV